MSAGVLDTDPGAVAAAEAVALRRRIAELESQLRRERSRREGVERGLEALSERLSEAQRENLRLRGRTGLAEPS